MLLTNQEKLLKEKYQRIVGAYNKLRSEQPESVSNNCIFTKIAEDEGMSVNRIRTIVKENAK